MPTEEIKNISGPILEAIKLKGFTLDKLSQLTGVPERALALLLEERFDQLPPAPYVRGYLVKVAEVLNLDGHALWQEYLKNRPELRKSGKEDVLPPNRFAIPKLNKKIVAASVVVLFVLGYLAFRLPGLFGRPDISITNLPADQTIVQEAGFTVHGIMNPADELTVNGEAVYPDKSGNFEKNLLLQPGFNNVTFQVKKLLGKTYVITKQIFYSTSTSNNGSR